MYVELIIGLAAAAALVVIVAGHFYMVYVRENRLSNEFRRLAAALKDGKFFHPQVNRRRVEFTYRGVLIDLHANFGAHHATHGDRATYVELCFAWPEPAFEMEMKTRIGVDGIVDQFWASLEGSQIQVGDDWIDQRFVVAGEPARTIRDLLPRIKPEIAHLINAFPTNGFQIFVTNGVWTIRTTRLTRTFNELWTLTCRCIDLLEVIACETTNAVQFLVTTESKTMTQAICPICGENVKQRVVRCVSCQTIHHRECWEFAGACSTYACGERGYDIVDGPPPVQGK